jgi:hypothetical protein
VAVIVNAGPKSAGSPDADAQLAVSLQDSWATRMAFAAAPVHLPNINV